MQPQPRHFVILPILLAVGYVLFKSLFTPTYVNPETGSRHKVGMDSQQEQALGLQAYQQVLQKEGQNRITSGPEVDEVTRVARRLASAASEKSQVQYQWQVSVIKSDEVNAFCLPGGEIVVYTGILPIAQTDAGLATVLGHEMAHATSRHGAQRMYRQQMTQALEMGAQGSLANMDYQQQAAAMAAIGAVGNYAGTLPFSREQESEADHIGLLYMSRAGYDPHQALDFWQRMSSATSRGAPPQFASDHPSNGVRIEQLQGWMPDAEKEYAASTMKDTKAPTQNTGM